MANGDSNNQTKYDDQFDANEFLSQAYNPPGTPKNYHRDLRMKMVHDLFEELLPDDHDSHGNNFKVLDYGCGPVIAYVISAAGKNAVSEIVLAEYTEMSRNALHKWLDRDATAFDWSDYFKHVVQTLEKKPETEVQFREERLRTIVKIASCDIKADPPIEEGFQGPYDLVMTFLAIESACNSEEEYFKLVENLSKLVKPGGHVLMFAKLAKTSQSILYNVGGKLFHYYSISEDILLSALKKAGLQSIRSTRVSIQNVISGLTASEIAILEAHPDCDEDEFFYISVTARKVGV